MPTKKIAVLGTGANGASIAADIAEAGHDVVLIDQWPAHVEAMRRQGLRIEMPDKTLQLSVRAFHLCEPCTFKEQFDVVFLAVKTYDTRWSCELIKPYVCLAYNNRPRAEQWRFQIDGVWTDVPIKARHIHSNNGDILFEAAVAGLGVIVLPTFIVSDAVARGALEVLLAGYEVASPSILAVWPPSRHVSGKVRAFIDLLAKRFAKTPYWDKFLFDEIESPARRFPQHKDQSRPSSAATGRQQGLLSSSLSP